jgi:hypothetical protein
LENKTDLRVVHLDFADPSFDDVYQIVSESGPLWLRDLPKETDVVCFSDTIFMVSRHWSSTFPDVKVFFSFLFF